MPRIVRLVLAAFAAALVIAPAALAGSPGKWTVVSGNHLRNIDEVALQRTADGTLHVVWNADNQANTAHDDLVHRPISKGGTAGVQTTITSDWAALGNVVDLVLLPDGGLRALFGGIHTTNSNEPNQNLNTATGPSSGAAWELFPGTVVKGDSAYGSDIGAAIRADGTPVISWGGTGSGVFAHGGLDPNTPNFEYQAQLGGCCGYSPDIAVDESGRADIAWYSNATGRSGVFVQDIQPADGSPLGAPVQMPGTTTLFNGQQESSQQLMRTPIVARKGGGIWLAYSSGYPVTTQAIAWKVGSPKQFVVGKSKGNHIVSIAADNAGHVWVIWIDFAIPGKPKVFAARSNKAATKFGPATPAGSPAGAAGGYRIAGEASAGTLDILGLFDTPGSLAQWHTQVLPPLVLTGPSSIKKSKTTNVTLTVSDPDPVAGAGVKGGGDSGTTSGSGKVTLSLGPSKGKSLTVKASKPGYVPAKLKIKLKK